jgi:hypothetical protein
MPARVIPGRTDLATLRPDLARQWHPTRNTRTPTAVTAGSNHIAWWICGDNGHTYSASVKKRTSSRGCPYCAGKRALTGFNDLATKYSDIASEWHPTRNICQPTDVVAKSGRRVWWQCNRSHEWSAPISQRTGNGSGCPVCSGRQLHAGYNDLATTHSVATSMWHPTRNTVRPDTLRATSTATVWWKCPDGHDFQMTVRSWVRRTRCPVCNRGKSEPAIPPERRRGVITVADSPFASEWSIQNPSPPTDYAHQSNQKAWWVCRQHGHEWQAKIAHRHIAGCPTCSGQRILAGFNDIATTHPEISKEWHPTRNDVASTAVGRGSIKRIWWQCALGHEWRETPNQRTSKGQTCPICRGRLLLTGYNDLSTLHPGLAAQWHPRNPLSPSHITAKANQKVWWICQQGHEWKTLIAKRIGGQGCPTCVGKRVAPGFNDFATLQPAIAAQWHPSRNTLLPTDVTVSSNRRVWWQCQNGHEWLTTVNKRSAGRECPDCVARVTSRRELAVCTPIALHFVTHHDGPQRVPGCRTPVDLALAELKIAIEYDGWYWHVDTAERDNAKTIQLHAAGWTVIRVRESSRGRELPFVEGILIPADVDERAEDVADRVIATVKRIS